MRDLSKIFNPKSVAIIGASAQEKTVGFGLVKNILEGKNSRQVFLVNPNQSEILGQKTFAKITDIPERVDLAVIAVPAKTVLEVAGQCCQKNVGAMIVISAGFAEIGEEGKARQEAVSSAAKKAGILLLGPNCLGLIRTENNLNASFAPATPQRGDIAFISQSGALLDSIVDYGLAMSCAISFGNEADVTLTDILEWLENDNQTKAIGLYVESISDGKKFMEAARRISKTKPIIAIKAGKFDSGKGAVKSHTGVMAGDYQVYKAVFRQTGIVEADSVEELIDLAKLLSSERKIGNNFTIVTNGGGCGVVAADYCKNNGVNLAKLSTETIEKISSSGGTNPFWSKSNPVDIVGDASPERYKTAIEAVLQQEDVKGLMVIQTPQIMTDPMGNAKAIVEAKNKFLEKPIICFFLGGKMSEPAIKYLEDNKIPNYSDLKRGIIAIKALINN